MSEAWVCVLAMTNWIASSCVLAMTNWIASSYVLAMTDKFERIYEFTS